MKTIQELQEVWNKDKETFKSKELGGLQSFVADILECKELFNLKQGLESTKNEDRINEFLREKNKNGRRADIVIFFKGNEIVIPVEVEKYCNIENGIKQLADYQNDYQKAYGILTDGFEWRFYNNTIYKKFTISEMFENPSMIKTFWEEYLKEENYYLNFFENIGQLKLDFIEETYRIEENKGLFFEDITNLIQKFKDKLGIVGYLQEKGTPNSDKKATEITYAYFIQFILYKNLVDNIYTYNDKNYKDFKNEFETRIANIHNCLKNKAYQGIASQIYGISSFISDKLYKPFNKEQAFINSKLQEILCKPEVILEEISLWLDIIVFIRKYNFANMKNEIFGYIYENYLKELYEENNKGQYFTDPAIVNFMLDEIGYTTKEIKKLYDKKQLDKLSIIDPSCGSGTFLYSAVHRIVEALFDGTEKRSKEIEEIINNNIFGLDIAEFPLYLAEMSILMRMLPIIFNEDYTNPIDKKIKIFKTKDSISEFMDTGISSKINTGIDEDTGQIALFEPSVLELSYNSYIRDEDDLKDMKESMQPPRRRFDFVIGNPPYIGYNQCCKQKILTFELMKPQNKKIFLNNIYGVNLHSVPYKHKKSRPNPNLYAFFIALGSALLKPKGKMCYIIPQTILNVGDLDVLRYYLSKKVSIEKIITFEAKVFIGRGLRGKKPIATSSLIFVINKHIPSINNIVEIIKYTKTNETNIENILNSKGKNKTVKKIKQSELLDNYSNWNYIINQNSSSKEISKEYNSNTDDISIYYDYNKANRIFGSEFYFDGGYSINEKNILNEKSDYIYPKIDNRYFSLKKAKGYWKNVRENKNNPLYIGLRQCNQGFKLLDSKFKIIWSYQNPNRFIYTDKPVIWARNQYNAIGANNKPEIIYLLSLLNSKINSYILKQNLLIKNEKNLLISTKSIKQYIRIPKIINKNNFIKQKIIKTMQNILNLEDFKISDFVDFSNFTIQSIDNYSFDEENLLLYKNNETYKLNILNKDKIKCIKYTLEQKYNNNDKLINLTDLKNTLILDTAYQNYLKNYIDDLFFILYFNIDIDKNIIDNVEKIHEICCQNKYYNLI